MVLPNENVTGGIMSIDDKLTINEHRKYLLVMQKGNEKAFGKKRGSLLVIYRTIMVQRFSPLGSSKLTGLLSAYW